MSFDNPTNPSTVKNPVSETIQFVLPKADISDDDGQLYKKVAPIYTEALEALQRRGDIGDINTYCDLSRHITIEGNLTTNIIETEQLLADKFQALETSLEEARKHHLGYPYNMKYITGCAERLMPYSVNNLGGDSYTDSNYGLGSRGMEREVIDYIAKLYRADSYWGLILHNGTEGNFKALHLARLKLGKGTTIFHTDQSHYSIPDGAEMLGMSTCMIKSQPSGEMDYEDLAKNLEGKDPNKVIVIANFGTTFTGAIDQIDEIKKVAPLSYVHVDGALGGMMIPFLDPNMCNFTKGMDSLTISGHKFIGSPLTSSILVLNEAPEQSMVEYIGAKVIGGSRNGHMAPYLNEQIIRRAGSFGYEVISTIQTAEYLFGLLEQAGMNPLLLPMSNTVVFDCPSADVVKKYQLACQNYKGKPRAHAITMQQHIGDNDLLQRFVWDCKLGRIK